MKIIKGKPDQLETIFSLLDATNKTGVMRFARHMALFPLGKQPGMEQKDFGVLQMNLSAGPSKTVGVSCLIYGNYTVQTVLP